MRISELATRTDVPLPTIKYYLREGLLHAGVATSRTRAEYDDGHVRRVAVIRALTDTVGLSVHAAREILRIIDEPGGDLFESLGRAIGKLPPAAAERDDYPRARATLERLGQVYDPRFAPVAQLESALAAAEASGLPVDDARLDTYARHARAIAEFDLERMPDDARSAIEYGVLGTALHEPVLLALRRLAHQDVAATRLGVVTGAAGPPRTDKRPLAPPTDTRQ